MLDRPPPNAQVLHCHDPHCPQCTLPFAVIQDGVLIIESRHGGVVHRNVITLARVQELLRESAPQERPAVEWYNEAGG